MNDVSSPAPGASLLPDSTSLITSVHFIVIALFALAVVAMIVVGIARKRRRKEADTDLEERVEQAQVEAAAEPAPQALEPAATAAPQGDGSVFALNQLKGLGPKVAVRLEELGITSVTQLAALDDAAAADIDTQLGTFAGRLTRDRWVEQARFLAAGDRAGFEARFGKL